MTYRVENQGAVRRWCVVHEPTDIAVLVCIRNKARALEASRHLATLPIRWESLHSAVLPEVSLAGHTFKAKTVNRLDAESASLLSEERARWTG